MSEAALEVESVPTLVEIRIPDNVARLAMLASKFCEGLSYAETVKLQSMLNKVIDVRRKPSAKNVFEMCGCVGFCLSMQMMELAKEREAERSATSDAC